MEFLVLEFYGNPGRLHCFEWTGRGSESGVGGWSGWVGGFRPSMVPAVPDCSDGSSAVLSPPFLFYLYFLFSRQGLSVFACEFIVPKEDGFLES